MTSVQRNVVDVLPNNLGDSKESLTHVDAREISVPAVCEVTGYLILDFLWPLKAGGSWLTKERQKFENFTEEKFQSFYQSAAINIEVINGMCLVLFSYISLKFDEVYEFYDQYTVFHENQDAVSIFVNGNLTSLTGYKTDVIQDF
ncbi:hypothetical protein RhiirA5_410756 [Rhizophagus irregularis]|uniref:Uncharacterized protein n=1 Tax=Rhizophagus irregularis TaxID=588596 RepID=A0A2I1ERU4_9GLOM|nr:hypothetical protein RhiirA5_410756 [Rhizophagus irregularis]PKC71313.1 hypothetical protein RhiirA1_453676 [Rhizophagus irregularis]PKY24785.1 hypothetical protein RhiirB3_439473 [Rhizophagus irregularis]